MGCRSDSAKSQLTFFKVPPRSVTETPTTSSEPTTETTAETAPETAIRKTADQTSTGNLAQETNPSVEEPSATQFSTGTVAGIVVGSAAAVLILCIAGFILYRRKRAPKKAAHVDVNEDSRFFGAQAYHYPATSAPAYSHQVHQLEAHDYENRGRKNNVWELHG